MKNKTLVRALAAAGCGLLAIGASGPAAGSDYPHSAVVSADAADWTPDLVGAGTVKPLA